MPQRDNDLALKHEIDQALAEAIELGRIRMVGERGDEYLLQLTPKGVVSTAIIFINAVIERSDQEKRDFTRKEKAEIAGHLQTMMDALKK